LSAVLSAVFGLIISPFSIALILAIVIITCSLLCYIYRYSFYIRAPSSPVLD
jgi:hypothetical protein